MRRIEHFALFVVAAVMALAGQSPKASAHPHVWVTTEATVVYADGKIQAIKQKWTFDDMYTAMAIQGLDANQDGVYTREELQELAKVNIDGLKEYNYFTYPKLGKAALKVKEPTEYWLEHKDNLLSLIMVVPLEEPVLADAEGFNFAIYDETFFIALDFAKENPVLLGEGAPQGCSVSLGIPENELADLQALNNSFGGQLTAGDQNQGMGFGYAKTATIGCKKT